MGYVRDKMRRWKAQHNPRSRDGNLYWEHLPPTSIKGLAILLPAAFGYTGDVEEIKDALVSRGQDFWSPPPSIADLLGESSKRWGVGKSVRGDLFYPRIACRDWTDLTAEKKRIDAIYNAHGLRLEHGYDKEGRWASFSRPGIAAPPSVRPWTDMSTAKPNS